MTATILVVDDEPDLEALVLQKFRGQIRDGSLTSAARTNAAGADGANSIVKRPDFRSRRNCWRNSSSTSGS